MRKLLFLLIFFTLPTFADSTEDEQQCSIFSSWVHAVAFRKAGGVPAKDVIYSLEQQHTIEENFKPVLQEIIDWLYDPNFPPITNGSEIAYVTHGAYRECVEERSKITQGKT